MIGFVHSGKTHTNSDQFKFGKDDDRHSDAGIADFKVVIITRDSASWIQTALKAYRSLGIEPLYCVDRRSSDGTADRLKDLAAEVLIFDMELNYLEAGAIEFAAKHVGDEFGWTLRMDDDEFPSLALLAWAKSSAKDKSPCWALSRRELIRDGNTIAYSRLWANYHTVERPEYFNAQIRLYRHRDMKYQTTIHTAGFELRNWDFAPEEAYFVHFDVLIRDLNERIGKLRRYDVDPLVSNWRFGAQCLPEIVPREESKPAALGTSEFDELIGALPVKAELESITLSTSELRTIMNGAFERQKFVERTERHKFEISLQKKGVAPNFVGEFLCTISRRAKSFPSDPCIQRLAMIVFNWGTTIQFRASARRRSRLK